MYAVIETGGKQYRVAVGDTVKVEKLAAEAGESIDIDRVLLVSGENGVNVGSPVVEGMPVSATVLSHGRGEKLRIFKMKRRKDYRKTQGHRQDYTELKITAIGDVNESAPAQAEAEQADEPVAEATD